MHQAGYHHANALANELRAKLNNRDSEVLLLIQAISDNSWITVNLTVRQPEPNIPSAPSLNIATESNDVKYEIINLLQDLKTEFNCMNTTTNRGNQNTNTNTQSSSGGR